MKRIRIATVILLVLLGLSSAQAQKTPSYNAQVNRDAKTLLALVNQVQPMLFRGKPTAKVMRRVRVGSYKIWTETASNDKFKNVGQEVYVEADQLNVSLDAQDANSTQAAIQNITKALQSLIQLSAPTPPTRRGGASGRE